MNRVSARRLHDFSERYLLPLWSPSSRQAWDLYAIAHRFDKQAGNEWNRPDLLGLSVEPEELISYLDREVLGPYLEPIHPRLLLEIGPGGGRVTEVLVRRCERLIAADISPLLIRKLKDRFHDSNSIDFIVLDGSSLTGIADHSVDAVVAYDVFVHLTHWDIFNYLLEIRRVLQSDGIAILHHSNVASELGWKHFATEATAQAGRKKMAHTFTPMTSDLMRLFAERAGLEFTTCLTDVIPRDAISILRSR